MRFLENQNYMAMDKINFTPGLEIITKYFPDLPSETLTKFEALGELYVEWNSQINVISRKNMEKLYEQHILHSLSIAKFINFKTGSLVLDVGTGGGFPGIPLAILFPETQFHLVDSIGKKIKVVRGVSHALQLNNVEAYHARAEQLDDKYDFVISRAVTRLKEFYPWVQNKFKKQHQHAIPNGIIYLKGGDLRDEIKEGGRAAQVFPIQDWFEEEFFETKSIVYVPFQKG